MTTSEKEKILQAISVAIEMEWDGKECYLAASKQIQQFEHALARLIRTQSPNGSQGSRARVVHLSGSPRTQAKGDTRIN